MLSKKVVSILVLALVSLVALTGIAFAEATINCAAPEPISASLFLLGGGALLIRKFQKRK